MKRFVLKDDEVHQSEVNGKLLVHGCPASALAWTPNGYFCGGADRKLVVYGKNGREMQRFDYSKKARVEHIAIFEKLVLAISSKILRVLMEHIERICSLESFNHFMFH